MSKISYLLNGERWENDPAAYVEEIGNRRAQFTNALARTNMRRMMSDWEDATLVSVVQYGSDLALNKKLGARLIAAAKWVLAKRYPAVAVLVNGMSETGHQK